MIYISGFSFFIAVYVTLYIIYLMKTAIDAEKAKTVKIENRLKLEHDRIKAELDVRKTRVANLKSVLKSQQSIINRLKKAKTVKIENCLKLEHDRIKAELDAEKETVADLRFILRSQQSNILKMKKSNWEAEKITIADLSGLLVDYFRDELAAANAKLRSEFEESQTVAIVADLKVKLCCRQKTIQSFKCELEHKDNVIKGLYALIESRKIDRY